MAGLARKRILVDFIALPTLDSNSRIPLQTQLYNALRQAILAGTLKPSTRLPSTRALSEQINLRATPY